MEWGGGWREEAGRNEAMGRNGDLVGGGLVHSSISITAAVRPV